MDRRLRCVTFESDQCTEQHNVHVYKNIVCFDNFSYFVLKNLTTQFFVALSPTTALGQTPPPAFSQNASYS